VTSVNSALKVLSNEVSNKNLPFTHLLTCRQQ